MLNPKFVLQILERFGIEVPDFLESLAEMRKGPQRV